MKWRASVLCAALVSGLLSGCSASSGADDRSGNTITAIFTDAFPVVSGNYVRAAGVKVGLIDSVNLVDGKAQVVMKLDKPIPMHTDAQAIITANNLLGERYIEIDNGSVGAPLMQVPYV